MNPYKVRELKRRYSDDLFSQFPPTTILWVYHIFCPLLEE